MNCGNFHHFISGRAGGSPSARAAQKRPRLGGENTAYNRVGPKGNFFSLVFVKEVSGGIAQKEHQTLRLYTLDVLTELKKSFY